MKRKIVLMLIGCIIISCLALVTYGDTETIKYTQHSNVKLSASSSKNIVYETEDASFYMPDTSNVTVEE